MKFKKFVLTALAVFCFSNANSQECNDVLFAANNHYKLGNLELTSSLLESCMSTLNNDDELFQAYRLLAIVYQDLNKLGEMNGIIEKMLKIKPDYQKYPNGDPLPFTKAVAMFKVEPSFYRGIHIDLTSNAPIRVKSFAAISGHEIYKAYSGYSFGAHFRKNLKLGIDVVASMSYAGTGISHSIVFDEGWKKEYKERIQMAEISVAVKKYFNLPFALRPCVGLDPGLAYFTSSRVNINTITPTGSIIAQNSKNGLDERLKFQPNIGFVGGVDLPLNRGAIGLQLGYYFFSSTTVDGKLRMDDKDFIFTTHYINDDIKLRLFKVRLAYTLPTAYRITL